MKLAGSIFVFDHAFSAVDIQKVEACASCYAMWVSTLRPKVVPFGGSYLEFYKVIPKRNYFGAYGYRPAAASWIASWPEDEHRAANHQTLQISSARPARRA